jgi:dihydroneopterin aldolase
MDKIIISNLEVFYHVGVTDDERATPQRLLITVEIAHDFAPAIASDNLGETVDYAALSRRLLGFGEGCQWQLIETLAADIASMILEEFKARAVTVEVKKFVIPQANYVAVTLSRQT